MTRATSRRLAKLYAALPLPSPCKPGCSDCCGPVPWAPAELAAIESDIPVGSQWVTFQGVAALENPSTGKCPFASSAGCQVYDRRPFMCRIFAAAAETRLACPHGCRAATPLSPQKARALTNDYRREVSA